MMSHGAGFKNDTVQVTQIITLKSYEMYVKSPQNGVDFTKVLADNRGLQI